jgi:uncharacterized protein with PQ loop repeat
MPHPGGSKEAHAKRPRPQARSICVLSVYESYTGYEYSNKRFKAGSSFLKKKKPRKLVLGKKAKESWFTYIYIYVRSSSSLCVIFQSHNLASKKVVFLNKPATKRNPPITHSKMMDILVVGDILGIVGGLILGVCLVPEIHLIIKQRSADDVSYTWLALYLLGLVTQLAYLIIVEALVGWATILVEISGVILIGCLKYKFAHDKAKKEEGPSETTKKDTLDTEHYTEHDSVVIDIIAGLAPRPTKVNEDKTTR